VKRLRRQLDPFGASLLDMMCCGLGAAIIVFVLRQMDAQQRIEAIRVDTTRMQQRAESAEATTSRANRQAARITKQLRALSRESVFGLPPIVGNLCVLIDRSGSMQEFQKLQVALDCVENIIKSNLGIGWLRISSFNTDEQVHFEESLPAPGSARRQTVTADCVTRMRSQIAAGGGTDIPKAARAALQSLIARGGGTMLVISDGISGGETHALAEALRSARRSQPSAGLRVHCIGLFRPDEVRAISEVGDLLRELTDIGGGVFVGVPTPIVPRDVSQRSP
jgi:hypothetical protein